MHFNVLIKIKCLETLRSISSSDSVSLGDPLMLVFGLCLQGSHPCSEDASKGSTVGQGSLARDTLWAGQCSQTSVAPTDTEWAMWAVRPAWLSARCQRHHSPPAASKRTRPAWWGQGPFWAIMGPQGSSR